MSRQRRLEGARRRRVCSATERTFEEGNAEECGRLGDAIGADDDGVVRGAVGTI